jgi:hypothetical protein
MRANLRRWLGMSMMMGSSGRWRRMRRLLLLLMWRLML